VEKLLPGGGGGVRGGGRENQARAYGEGGGHGGLDGVVQGLPRKAHRHQARVPHTLDVVEGAHKPPPVPRLAAQGKVVSRKDDTGEQGGVLGGLDHGDCPQASGGGLKVQQPGTAAASPGGEVGCEGGGAVIAGVGGAAALPGQHGENEGILGGYQINQPLKHFCSGGGEKVIEEVRGRKCILALIPVEDPGCKVTGSGSLAVHKALHSTLVRAQPKLALHASG